MMMMILILLDESVIIVMFQEDLILLRYAGISSRVPATKIDVVSSILGLKAGAVEVGHAPHLHHTGAVLIPGMSAIIAAVNDLAKMTSVWTF